MLSVRRYFRSFKIAAQSRHEMMPLYRKLNFLVSNVAPEYKVTRMRTPFIRLTNPEIYNFYGKWRILNEREIDMFREGGNYYSFREFDWKFVTSTILGAYVYSFHGHKFVLGNSQGGTQKFVVGTINDLTSIKNGVFDTE